MVTLYVSDLDGTLLNKKKEITPKTAEILNRCIREGMKFSVATARMPYGCDYRLQDLAMTTPGILTNGVFLYDFNKQRYLDVQAMEPEVVKNALKIFRRFGISCFLYFYKKEQLSLYYEDQKMESQVQYYSERALESCSEVKRVDDLFEILQEGKVVYLAVTDCQETLSPVLEELGQVSGLRYAYYLNIYNGLYCLEVFSDQASKKEALLKLKEMTGCDQVVVFGDNLNDLPMIEIADRSYAPANALEEIKGRVTGVLDDCDHDGVAKFLEREWKNK